MFTSNSKNNCSYTGKKLYFLPVVVVSIILFYTFPIFSQDSTMIEDGLTWLRGQQNATYGYWTGTYSDRVGTTALVLQAFLAQGYSPQTDQTVEDGINYLLSQVQANGGIYNSGTRSGYASSIAITALRSAAKYNPPNLTQINTAISNAQQYFVTYQSTYGGWRYYPHTTNESDLSVSQWVILALEGVDNPTLWTNVSSFLHNYVRNNSTGGYGYSNNSATGTMTCAGIWGEIIAEGPQANVDAAFNWLVNQYGTANGIVNAYNNANQFYYYLYSLAKACALNSRTLLAGEDWYEILYNKLSSSQSSNHWTNPNAAWENPVLATAFALLSLQTGTVPPGSRFIIRLYSPPADGLDNLPSDVLLNVYDGNGNFAGKNESDVWITNIPNSQWNSTTDYYELEVALTSAESFTTEIVNNDISPIDYGLDLEAYQDTNSQPVSSVTFTGSVVPGQSVGTTAAVNAIGGLTIYAPTPTVLPLMVLNPTQYDIRPIENDSTYIFDFTIYETRDSAALKNIDIFASDLTDPYANTISASNFSFVPSHIDSIPAGGSAVVQVTLTVPDSNIVNLSDVGEFEGLITIQSFNQTKAIQLSAGVNFQILVTDFGGSSQILTFGQAHSATDSLNTGLGELELPPLPPPGVFDARFEFPTDPPIYSYVDLRNDTLKAIDWKFIFQGTPPFDICWDPDVLPNRTFYLVDGTGGLIVDVDMKTDSCVSVTIPGIAMFIKYGRQNDVVVDVDSGWNIVSAPLQKPNMSMSSYYPGYIPNAYKFIPGGGYQVDTTLELTHAYWMKFPNDTSYSVTGLVHRFRTDLESGWNMVGPFDFPVPVSSIESVPSGIITSNFFEYQYGYQVADILKPGKGYWVKTSSAGKVILDPTILVKGEENQFASLVDQWGKIFIEDAEGNKMTLYVTEDDSNVELPPYPPSGIFDARFTSDRLVENISEESKRIKLSSSSYPITISVENLELKVNDIISGDIINEELHSGDRLVISDPNISILSILKMYGDLTAGVPGSYELYQNYPNPFNPVTLIKFAIPKESRVSLRIYNILGEEVTSLIDKEMKPGYYEVEFNASNFVSGVYLYSITAGDFRETKKMILMK